MKPLLGINIDHVATLRQARRSPYPSIVDAAQASIAGGAGQITVHLREDRRHIQDRDIFDLKKAITVPLNLEMAVADEIVGIALELKPHTATIVPEKRHELTTEGGLDCVVNAAALKKVINKLKKENIIVSLFIDPEAEQVHMAKELGAQTIELHTGRYCECAIGRSDDRAIEQAVAVELAKLKESVTLGKSLGLRICAGHGLNYDNTARIVKEIPEIVEYNIGHAVVARAVFVGLEKAVKEMRGLL